MIVIADTSPLNYLVLIHTAHVLPQLYRQVLIPEAVLAELQDSDAPAAVAAWVSSLPRWVEVQPAPDTSDTALDELDAGERAAIALAQALPPPVLLLMDDVRGRNEASRRQIPVTGTLGVLQAAAIRDLLDLPTALARLGQTNFRTSAALIEELLAADAERKRRHQT